MLTPALISIILIFVIIIIIAFGLLNLSKKVPRREGPENNAASDGVSQFCIVQGVKIHYQVFGAGDDILLLHGLAASIYCWRFVVPLLSPYYRVWAVDIKGFGQSEAPRESRYDLQSQAENISEFLKIQNIKKAAVIGSSMGGAIAAELCVKYPELIKKLILINSAHDPMIVKFNFKKLRNFVPLLAPLVRTSSVKYYMKQLYGKGYKFSDADVARYLAPYLESDLNRHRAFLESFDALSDKNLMQRMSSIEIGTLLIWGESDKLVPLKFGKRLHRLMKKSQLLIHPTAGHHLQEEEPAWLTEKILLFLQS